MSRGAPPESGDFIEAVRHQGTAARCRASHDLTGLLVSAIVHSSPYHAQSAFEWEHKDDNERRFSAGCADSPRGLSKMAIKRKQSEMDVRPPPPRGTDTVRSTGCTSTMTHLHI